MIFTIINYPMASILLLSFLTLTHAAPLPLSLPQTSKRTRHLYKRYYGPSILGSVLALAFILFWLGACIWYIRHRRRIGRTTTSIEDVFMWRVFPWMEKPVPQLPPPQPTVVVVNNNNGPPVHPAPGMYTYGEGYPYSQTYVNTRPQPFQPNPNVMRPASPAPAYRG